MKKQKKRFSKILVSVLLASVLLCLPFFTLKASSSYGIQQDLQNITPLSYQDLYVDSEYNAILAYGVVHLPCEFKIMTDLSIIYYDMYFIFDNSNLSYKITLFDDEDNEVLLYNSRGNYLLCKSYYYIDCDIDTSYQSQFWGNNDILAMQMILQETFNKNTQINRGLYEPFIYTGFYNTNNTYFEPSDSQDHTITGSIIDNNTGEVYNTLSIISNKLYVSIDNIYQYELKKDHNYTYNFMSEEDRELLYNFYFKISTTHSPILVVINAENIQQTTGLLNYTLLDLFGVPLNMIYSVLYNLTNIKIIAVSGFAIITTLLTIFVIVKIVKFVV